MTRLVDTINRLGKQETFQVVRPGAGVRVKGRWERPAPQEFPAVGSVQQADAQTMMMLPEGVRNRETVIVHTDCELQNADVDAQREADQLTIRDRTFEVMLLSDWTREGGFTEAVCVRLGQ